MSHLRWVLASMCVPLAALLAASCRESSAGQQGSETNWLGGCDDRTRCAKGSCVCGICTSPCSADDACAGGVCLATSSAAYRSLCSDASDATAALCAARCDGLAGCSAGMRCTDGACVPRVDLDAGVEATLPARDGALEGRARCPVPAMSTSDEAIAAIECQFGVPPGAFLAYVRSNANGSMSLDGRSPDWTFIYDAPAARVVHGFDVSGAGVTANTTPDNPGFDCGSAPLTLLSSSRVAPDAIRRVAVFATYDHVDGFLEQSLPCFGGAGSPTLGYVTLLGLRHTDSGKDLDAWWFSHYDQTGAFLTLCGPCPTNQVLACVTCAPGGLSVDGG